MKAKAFLSAFAGFLFGLICYVMSLLSDLGQPFPLSVLSGLLFALLLFPVLIICGNRMDKRYKAFEKEITSPIFYRTNGNFDLGNGKVKNGMIYFCEAGIVCVCLEDKPYSLDEILLRDIDHYSCTLTQLAVFTNDKRLFVITLPETTDGLIDLLMRKGWIEPR